MSLSKRLLVDALSVLRAPLAGSVSLNLSKTLAAGVGVNILDVLEGHSRNEALRLPCLVDLAVELVDLLEGKSLGLVDHGPHEEDTDEAASTPDEEDLGAHVGISRSVVDHVWCGIADGEVEKPVGSCRV